MANSTIDKIKINLKTYRQKAKLTQEQLSELAGISCDYLSEIERGKRVPSIKRLVRIADALRVDAYLLLK